MPDNKMVKRHAKCTLNSRQIKYTQRSFGLPINSFLRLPAVNMALIR